MGVRGGGMNNGAVGIGGRGKMERKGELEGNKETFSDTNPNENDKFIDNKNFDCDL